MQAEPQLDAAIELRDVVKTFGSTRVLDGVSFEVPRGQTTVLLGPSGAGKTVTIDHVVGLLRPTSGAVCVEGANLAELTDEELNAVRERLSVVLQGSLPFTCGLFFSLTVFENVAFPLRRRHRWTEEQVREEALMYLGMVGLRDRAESMPAELSAGMCKRVAIARALAPEPQMVIIDDFDSGIDGVRLALLCDLFSDYREDTGATFFVSTHNMAAARKLADHVVVIHEGRIVASGPATEVLDSEQPLVHQLVSGSTSGPIKLRDV